MNPFGQAAILVLCLIVMARTQHLDTIGLLCPLPVLRVIKQMRDLQSGDQLIVKADDPAAHIDIPHYCHENGHLLLDVQQSQNQSSFRIQKIG